MEFSEQRAGLRADHCKCTYRRPIKFRLLLSRSSRVIVCARRLACHSQLDAQFGPALGVLLAVNRSAWKPGEYFSGFWRRGTRECSVAPRGPALEFKLEEF